jgi:ribosomal protein L37AE/L43A
MAMSGLRVAGEDVSQLELEIFTLKRKTKYMPINKQEDLEEIKSIVRKIYIEEDLMGGANDIKKLMEKAKQSGIEEERKRTEQLREIAGIVWVCPQCATKFFNRIFTVDTNIYTQTNMDCDCCKEERPCMHINSYGKPKE